MRVFDRLAHDDALAGCQPGCLDDDRGAERRDRATCGRDISVVRCARRGDTRVDHHVLREPLRCLEARGGRRRAERGNSLRPKHVGQAGCERSLGPDDHEVHVLGRRQLRDTRDVRRGNWYTTRELRDARVARCSEELEGCVVALQLPGEGVLAPAPADDQCLHESDVLNALLNASRARARTSPTCAIASRAWLP